MMVVYFVDDEAREQYGALMKILISHDTSCRNDIVLMYRGIDFSRKMPLYKSKY